MNADKHKIVGSVVAGIHSWSPNLIEESGMVNEEVHEAEVPGEGIEGYNGAKALAWRPWVENGARLDQCIWVVYEQLQM